MRRFALMCAVVTAGFAAVVAVGLAATGHRGSPPREPMVAPRSLKSPGALTTKLGSRSLRSVVRRQRLMATPAEVSERVESQTRFAALDESAAFETVEHVFPATVAPSPAPISDDDRVIDYENGEHAAIVVPAEPDKDGGPAPGKENATEDAAASDTDDVPESRKPQLLASTMPLRVKDRDGQLSPVSAQVTETTPGELRPKNPLTDIIVHRDLEEGIRFPDADLGLRVTGANLDTPSTVLKDRVFWANVQTDTDLMVRMRPDGVETYHVLRSRQSPERLSYDLDVPEGGAIALDESRQVIEISDKEGKKVANVSPAVVLDADGSPVPARWLVQGTLVQIAVEHRQADVRYPILVDPLWIMNQDSWEENASIDFGGWAFTESNPNALAKSQGDAGWGRGLNIWLPPNLTTPANLWGMWYMNAPGNTNIAAFEMGFFSYVPLGGRNCAVTGILEWVNPLSWAPGSVTTIEDSTGDTANGPSPWLRCPPDYTLDQYQLHTPNPSRIGKAAAFQWWAPNVASGPNIDLVALGGAKVYIADDHGPNSFTQTGLSQLTWSKNDISFAAYATDPGLGMKRMRSYLDDISLPVNEVNSGCVADFRAANHCPATQGLAVQIPRSDGFPGLSDGIHEVTITGEDALYNVGTGVFAARIDRRAPEMELSGPAYDRAGQDVGAASYAVHVSADDKGLAPEVPTSGVKLVELLVDGAVVGSKSQPCEAGCIEGEPRPLEADLAFDADAASVGTHNLQVRVTDEAGNATSSATWQLKVVSATVTSPVVGQHVARRVTLQANTRRSGISNVRWDYRVAATSTTAAGPWTTIPASALRDTSGSTPSSTAIGFSGSDSNPVSWDITATPGLGTQSKGLEVRGALNGGTTLTTDTAGLTFDTKGLDDRTARSKVGPGAVNLMTGNFAITEDDVAIAGGVAELRVNRTYNSRDATTSGPLGPGWKLAGPVLDGVDAVGTLIEHLDAGYVELTLGDGTIIAFGVGRDEQGHAVYRTPAGYERFSLTSDLIPVHLRPPLHSSMC